MTRVKICGITNLEDALVAVEAGADLLGFIFYEPSPRAVGPAVVKEIVARVRQQATTEDAGPETQNLTPQAPILVGVFVNASLETITHILETCRLDAAQLHGEESPEFVGFFQGRAYKALRPQSLAEAEASLEKYHPFPSTPGLPSFLLDAYQPSLYGGTGHVTDWRMAAQIARQHPFMLAGSLTPANVAQAIEAVQPWGVDVSSGVEWAKGRKDHRKVKAFLKAVKGVEMQRRNK